MTVLHRNSFRWIPESDVFPSLEHEAEMGDWEMAKDYAGKLLQSEANTMFVMVEVLEWRPFSNAAMGDDYAPSRRVMIDLCTTRGVKERGEHEEGRLPDDYYSDFARMD